MSISESARNFFVHRIVEELASLSAVKFERTGHLLAENLSGVPLRQRGQSTRGNPQGYTVDSHSYDGTIAAEFGTGNGYFSKLKKPKSDYKHVRKLMPGASTVFLLSTQQATPDQATKAVNWTMNVASRSGVQVHVLDARDIAEYVVDHVFQDETAFARIAEGLPILQWLHDLYAASGRVPLPWAGIVDRPGLRHAIIERLDTSRIAYISGMSGIGKSAAALQAAEARRHAVGWTVWVSDCEIEHAAELESIPVSRWGTRHNVKGLLAKESCLVILDNLIPKADPEQLAAEIKAICNDKSSVIITSQVGVSANFGVPVQPMDEREARQLLEFDVTACPKVHFGTIRKAVGGHPLALRMLNGYVRDGATWSQAASDAAHVGELPMAQMSERLADVIVSRRRAVIEAALAFFVWAGAPRVHECALVRAVGYAKVAALKRLGLVTPEEWGTVRLHDVVWTSLSALQPSLEIPATAFGSALHEFVTELASDDAGTLELNHFARLHQSLLFRLVHSSEQRSGHLYAWLHFRGPGVITAGMLPEPIARAEKLLKDGAVDFDVQVTSELAEAVVYLTRKEEAMAKESQLLLPFDMLIASEAVSAKAKVHVRHHWRRRLNASGTAIRQRPLSQLL